jgi:hypothetical protein
MQNPVFVDVEHAFQQLPSKGSEVVLGEVEGVIAHGFEHVQEVAFAVLKDHVDGGGDVGDWLEVVCVSLRSLGGGGGEGAAAGGGGDFLEANHVLVGHAAEELDFTEGGDGELNEGGGKRS